MVVYFIFHIVSEDSGSLACLFLCVSIVHLYSYMNEGIHYLKSIFKGGKSNQTPVMGIFECINTDI